jgi:peptidoglycan/LPS O-acetylase OafA/YrhL
MYFLIGWKKGLAVLSALFFAAFGYFCARRYLTLQDDWTLIGLAEEIKHYGWFAAGALGYRYAQTRRRIFPVLALVLATFAALALEDDLKAPALLVAPLFFATLAWPSFRQLFGSRLFVFFGFISYPLYLCHENAMIAMIVKLGHAFPHFPALLMPLPALFLLVPLSWLVARFAEPAIREALRRDPRQKTLQPSAPL